MFRNIARCVFVVALAASLSSCIFVPAIDAYNQLGLSKVDREKLISKEVKSFLEALYWGQSGDALRFVKEESREGMAPILRKDLENTRVVDWKVSAVDFADDSRKATVTVAIRFYKVPFYVVTDRTEKQVWEFTLSDGWKFVSKGEVVK